MEELFMEQAYIEALKAQKKDEVPVGAVIVYNNKIVARAHNLKNSKKCVTKHAEILAIEKASKKLNDFRLNECIMYVTLEPCPMCAGAILASRIKKLVFSVFDKSLGASGSVIDLINEPKFYGKCEIVSGVLSEKCKNLLPDFFKNKRNK